MISDAEILQYIGVLYAYPSVAPVVWDHLDTGLDDDGVYWALKRLPTGERLLIMRGSVTLLDFERDAEATVKDDVLLGPVHAGFVRGVYKAWTEAKAIIGTAPWIAAGHSLGAARACLIAGYGVVTYHPPVRCVRFGEPRPGMQRLADILAHVPGASYRTADADGHDIVTDVPFSLPPTFPYVHPSPLIDVVAHPAADDPWGPVRYHRWSCYVEGLKGNF